MLPDTLESVLSLHEETDHQKSRVANSSSSKLGRPSLILKFPEIVDIASKYIKSHGYAAHTRRRVSVASAPGVSLANIQNHLLQNVPGLREHGISRSTIARMMNPPRRNTIASGRYKGVISARVPGKKNSYREERIDQHYLFA